MNYLLIFDSACSALFGAAVAWLWVHGVRQVQVQQQERRTQPPPDIAAGTERSEWTEIEQARWDR